MMSALQEWKRGWPVVAGAAATFGFGFANTGYLNGLFVLMLHDQFGWSRGSIGLAANATFVAAVAAPFIGRLSDRIGVRPVLTASSIVVGLSYIAFTLMGGDILVYYILYVIFATFGIAMTGMTLSRAVTTWFDKSRGLALCCVNFGLTTVGLVLPSLLYALYAEHGWKAVYFTLSAFALILCLPIVLYVVRENPDERASGMASSVVPEDDDPEGWRPLLRKPRFWLLCLAAAFTIGPVIGLMSQLQPMLVDKGFEGQLAANLVGIIAVAVFSGGIFSGYLTDRIWAPLIGFAFTVAGIFGCLLMLWGPATVVPIALAIFLVGIAYGAEMQVLAYLVARYFGTRHYATLFGLTVLTSTFACGTCQILYGLCFDYFGNYRPALWASAILFSIAAPSYLLLGRYPGAVGKAKPGSEALASG